MPRDPQRKHPTPQPEHPGVLQGLLGPLEGPRRPRHACGTMARSGHRRAGGREGLEAVELQVERSGEASTVASW